ncbi:MAG TPA: hypothetical protein VHQ20_02275, partial [Patescibacteria group bacterium]|nr:hypothetical protein [Patescibacteria group bacterium]
PVVSAKVCKVSDLVICISLNPSAHALDLFKNDYAFIISNFPCKIKDFSGGVKAFPRKIAYFLFH